MSHHEIDELAQALEGLTGDQLQDNSATVPPGQRPCPICGQHMANEFNDGVHIDVCAAHGIWLDNGELGSLLRTTRTRANNNRAQAIRRARQDGKVSGILFGTWSLLFR